MRLKLGRRFWRSTVGPLRPTKLDYIALTLAAPLAAAALFNAYRYDRLSGLFATCGASFGFALGVILMRITTGAILGRLADAMEEEAPRVD